MALPAPTDYTSPMGRSEKPGIAQANLTSGPVGRILWESSWPMTIGLFSIIVFNIVDTFYIGQLGPDHLAAMGFCFPVIFAMGSLAVGLGVGSLSVVSRAIGAGYPGRARRLASSTMLLVTLLSLLLTAAMFSFSDYIFALLRTPDRLMPYVDQYMDVWFAGLLFLIAPVCGNYLVRANGAAKASSILMIAAAAINAILSPLLVFGLLGFPELGMSGAALATIVARGAILVGALYYMTSRHSMIEISWRAVRAFPRHSKEVLRFAIPAGLSQMVVPLSTAIIVAILAGYGEEVVAGFTVGARVETLLLIPFWAFQTGLAPFIGQNFGARLPARLSEAEGWIWKFSAAWGLFSMIFLIGFGGTIGALFTKDPDIIAYTDSYLTLATLGYVFAGVFQASLGVINPLGYPNYGAALSVFRHIILYAGLALLLAKGFMPGINGPSGVFLASAAAWTIAGITAGLLVNRLLPAKPAGPTAIQS